MRFEDLVLLLAGLLASCGGMSASEVITPAAPTSRAQTLSGVEREIIDRIAQPAAPAPGG